MIILILDLNVKNLINGKDCEAGCKTYEDDGDAVQKSMGYLGRWQILVCTAISLVKFPVAWHQLAIVFMAPKKQKFTCSIPGYTNATDQCYVQINESTVECTQWEFDRSVFPETIISQVIF